MEIVLEYLSIATCLTLLTERLCARGYSVTAVSQLFDLADHAGELNPIPRASGKIYYRGPPVPDLHELCRSIRVGNYGPIVLSQTIRPDRDALEKPMQDQAITLRFTELNKEQNDVRPKT